MPSLSEAAIGGDPKAEWSETQLELYNKLSPLTLSDWADLERWLVVQHANKIARMASLINDPEVKRGMLQQSDLLDFSFTSQVGQAYLFSTAEGLLRVIEQMMRKKVGGIQQRDVPAHIQGLSIDEITDVIAYINKSGGDAKN